MLDDLAAAGYAVSDAPQIPRELLDTLARGSKPRALRLAQYESLLAAAATQRHVRLREAWGDPAADPDVRDGAFYFRARKFGNLGGIAARSRPQRGTPRRLSRSVAAAAARAGRIRLWLQHVAKADALVHMGAHGTLEWLPGKAVALTADCFPEFVTGPLPVIYPFIVSNPGEAAQAKRRIAGVTIGHLPPPLVGGGPRSGDARELERLIDEYAQADGLDRRRRERLARLIVETAQRTGLAREAGISAGRGEGAPTMPCGASMPGCAI